MGRLLGRLMGRLIVEIWQSSFSLPHPAPPRIAAETATSLKGNPKSCTRMANLTAAQMRLTFARPQCARVVLGAPFKACTHSWFFVLEMMFLQQHAWVLMSMPEACLICGLAPTLRRFSSPVELRSACRMTCISWSP